MSSGVFRGKESSNRIKLSRLVQDLLNFGVLGPLQLWGGGRWVGGASGVSSKCTHTHVYMYRNCKWLPTWRNPCLAYLLCLACMCACMGHPPHTHIPPPPSTHLPPPQGTPRISKNLITLETNQDISIPFEDLKSVKNSPLMVWWVDGWDQVKTLKFKKNVN